MVWCMRPYEKFQFNHSRILATLWQYGKKKRLLIYAAENASIRTGQGEAADKALETLQVVGSCSQGDYNRQQTQSQLKKSRFGPFLERVSIQWEVDAVDLLGRSGCLRDEKVGRMVYPKGESTASFSRNPVPSQLDRTQTSEICPLVLQLFVQPRQCSSVRLLMVNDCDKQESSWKFVLSFNLVHYLVNLVLPFE